MAGFPSPRDVSESRRERETFRYDPSLIAKTVYSNVENLVPASELRSSPDAALTSFAQLAVLRLNATRALISLFDSKYQYIVAEATPSLDLSPNADLKDSDSDEHFVLAGTAIPRASGICEIALAIPPSPGPLGTESVGELPVTVIPDISSDARSSQRSYCHHAPQNRFYAGVPIRSNKGINIGVFCVFDNEPRESLDNKSIRVMQDLSKIIMDHLDAKRNRDEHRRSDRMVRGVGSFVEGKSTMSGWRLRPNADSFKDDPSMEGGLNRHQQKLQRETEDPTVDENAHEADILISMFPGARSVAVFPLWDPQKQR
ncbi:Histidine kinase 5, partial [Colletotrichum sp. SAR 10_96]